MKLELESTTAEWVSSPEGVTVEGVAASSVLLLGVERILPVVVLLAHFWKIPGLVW